MMQNKNFKIMLFSGIVIILAAAASYFGLASYRVSHRAEKEKTDFAVILEKLHKENLEIKNSYAKIQGDYARLQKDHQDLISLNKTFVDQSKELAEQKGRAKKLTSALERTSKDKASLEQETEELITQNVALKDKTQQLETVQKQLISEKEQLSQTLERERDKNNIKKIIEENSALKSNNSELAKAIKQLRSENALLKENDSKLNGQIKQLSAKIKQYDEDFTQALEKNRRFEKKVSEVPSKFAEIARQNKSLIRETANMHYNLGVFYTKQREYSRAISEFEKCIDLTPDDAYAHFNLGYIYAELIVNRERAVRHFRDYLRLAKKEDKDVDWVKNYLITWDSFEGKKPVN